MRTSRCATIIVASIVLSSVITTTAWAGEITGNGKSTALQGNSWCRYSGLNDTPGLDGFGQTQNWGQVIRLYGWVGDPGQYNPSNWPFDFGGINCNPNNTGVPVPRDPGSPNG
jgi:hypothetical protein